MVATPAPGQLALPTATGSIYQMLLTSLALTRHCSRCGVMSDCSNQHGCLNDFREIGNIGTFKKNEKQTAKRGRQLHGTNDVNCTRENLASTAQPSNVSNNGVGHVTSVGYYFSDKGRYSEQL